MRKRPRLSVDPDKQQFTPSGLLPGMSPERLSYQERQSDHFSSQRSSLRSSQQDHLAPQYEKQFERTSSNPSDVVREQSGVELTSIRNRLNTFVAPSQKDLSSQKIPAEWSSKKITPDRRNERHSSMKLFDQNNVLENIVRDQKIKRIQKNFLKKIRRTSTARQPVQWQGFMDWQKEYFWHLNGIELNPMIDNLINLSSVLQIIALSVIYSISITFEDLIEESPGLSTFQMISLLFYFVEIGLNLVTVKSQAGKKIVVLKDIFRYYLSNNLVIDVLSFMILLLDISGDFRVISYLRLFIVFKLPQCLNKIDKLEVYFIQNIYNQQYWNLAKVFIVNFCYAHIIALCLAAMASLDTGNNWMLSKGIDGSSWIERYVWSYYWATNIMLTVGFGDLAAHNYKEAICLIFIETFSCIVMAYNINCMGTIISNIRAQDQKRSKKFKIFKKLTDQNHVPQDLTFKISNYIEESANLKKMFNFQEDRQFLNDLPETLRVSYLRQANKQVMKQLVFFKDLLDKTLYSFAARIETKISHPQQVIRAINDDFDLLILRKGEIGYGCMKKGCGLNEEIFDLVKVEQGDNPFLTSLDFISKIRPLYEIISLSFSVLFRLDYGDFIETFRQHQMDYELFCYLRDKIRNIPDQFEVRPCQFCGNFNHFKFSCPRIHYIPYEQHVIDKELHRQKIGSQVRFPLLRKKALNITPFELYKRVKKYREKMKEQQIRRQSEINSTSFGLRRSQLVSLDQTQDKLEDLFSVANQSKTKQLIQIQFLNQERKRDYTDSVWVLQLDKMMDFNSYFHEHNPKSVGERFSQARRQASGIPKDLSQRHLQSIASNRSMAFNDKSIIFTQKTLARLIL